MTRAGWSAVLVRSIDGENRGSWVHFVCLERLPRLSAHLRMTYQYRLDFPSVDSIHISDDSLTGIGRGTDYAKQSLAHVCGASLQAQAVDALS